jgi:hypothetical protein
MKVAAGRNEGSGVAPAPPPSAPHIGDKVTVTVTNVSDMGIFFQYNDMLGRVSSVEVRPGPAVCADAAAPLRTGMSVGSNAPARGVSTDRLGVHPER